MITSFGQAHQDYLEQPYQDEVDREDTIYDEDLISLWSTCPADPNDDYPDEREAVHLAANDCL
jgi:hypothetical protein